MSQQQIGAGGSAARRERDPAAETLAKEPGGGHVVGVDVRLERVAQPEAEFGDQSRVPLELLEDRVDENRLLRVGVRQEVRVGRRARIEELAKQHGSHDTGVGS